MTTPYAIPRRVWLESNLKFRARVLREGQLNLGRGEIRQVPFVFNVPKSKAFLGSQRIIRYHPNIPLDDLQWIHLLVDSLRIPREWVKYTSGESH